MTPPSSRTTRITTIVVAGAVAVVVAGTAFGATRPDAGAAGDPSASTAAPVESTTVAPSDSPTAAPSEATASAVPTPQPTTTAPLTETAPIRTDLTAEVVSMQAVQGEAAVPGEVAGPAVRFTVRLHNATAAAFSLADTVVNATSGADAEPGYPLTEPGGKPFPATVPAGATVTGVYLFTIPRDDRDRVTVTIDTSTATPVVAFTGAAPR